MLIWQDADPEEMDAPAGAPHDRYDTSSGDSCWVRQYLEWCEAVGAVWPEDLLRLHSGTVRIVHATGSERAIAILRSRGRSLPPKLSMDGEGKTQLERLSPIA